MAIGTSTGERYDSHFGMIVAKNADKQPVTQVAGDISVVPTLPYDVKTDSDTPGVATNPKSYYDERIMRQPYRGDPTEGVIQTPNAGKPLGDRSTPMMNLSGKPKISLNDPEEASPFKVAMADMAPEGMRIPVAKTQGQTKQDLSGGGGGGGSVESIKGAAIRSEGKVLEGPSHFDIVRKNPKMDLDKAEDGFVTASGKFVSREEAMQIMQARKDFRINTKRDYLISEDLPDSDYNKYIKPRLLSK